MSQAQFATIDDFYFFQGLPTPNDLDPSQTTDPAVMKLNALLRRASSRVARIVRTSRIRYGADGKPSETPAAQTLRDMTAAQAVWMQAHDDDGTGDVAGEWDSVSLIGVQFSKSARAQAEQAVGGGSLDPRYSPEALEIYASSGLASTRVRS